MANYERIEIPEEFEHQVPEDFRERIKQGAADMMGDAAYGGSQLTSEDLLKKMWNDFIAMKVVFMERLRRGETHEVAVVAISLFLTIFLAYGIMVTVFGDGNDSATRRRQKEEEEKAAKKGPPRDYTLEQLRTFDGRDEKQIDGSMAPKPVYVALKRDVYDVSEAADLYGKGAAYHCFAGREASRAMGKFSFDEEYLSNPRYDDLTGMERDNLEAYVDKFKYHKEYPVVGRVSIPPKDLTFTRAMLKAHRGEEDEPVPQGRVHAPIYMAVNGRVLDVSYGGHASYGPGGPYHLFAGIDASRALAKMSFKDEDVAGSSDLSDLTEEQMAVLADWEKRFVEKSLYPVVGLLVDEDDDGGEALDNSQAEDDHWSTCWRGSDSLPEPATLPMDTHEE